MAELILISIEIYSGIGCVFTVWFVSKGVGTMDPSAAHAP